MIFIYDNNEKQIDHLNIIPTVTEEIGKVTTLEFTSEIEFKKGYRVVYEFENKKHEFIIVDTNYTRGDGVEFYYYCQESIVELQSAVIIDIRPWGNIQQVMTSIFKNTRWSVEVRANYNLNQIEKNTFYHTTVFEAFAEAVEKYKSEWITEYNFSNDKITERKIVLYQNDGKSSGRLEFGKNIKSFSRRILPEPIVTLLYPYGKGEELESGVYGRRINISSVNNGKEYIENKQATEIYGYGEKGNKTPLRGFKNYDDIEDPKILLEEAKKDLEVFSQPHAEYTVDAIHLDFEAVKGIEVPIIDEKINYKGYARIIKLVRNGKKIEVTFGTVTKKFVDEFQKQIDRNKKGIKEAFKQVNQVKISADGKNRIFTGAIKPEVASEGDMWYRYNSDGTVNILFYKNGIWEEETGKRVFKKLNDDLEASKKSIEEAKTAAEEASAKVDEEVKKMGDELSLFKADTDSVLSIIKDPEKKGLLSAINQQAGNVLIQVEDNATSSKLNITKDGTFIDKGVIQQANIDIATITDALLKNVKFDWATGKTLNAQQVNVINLDANNITANKSEFVQSAWNSINSSVQINGNGMYIDGDWGGAINFTRRGLTFYDKIKGQVMGYSYGLYRNNDDPRKNELMQGIFLGAELGYNLKLGIRTEIYNQNTTFLEINGVDRQTTRGTIFGELTLTNNLILGRNAILVQGNSGIRFGYGKVLDNAMTTIVNNEGTAGFAFSTGGGVAIRRYDNSLGRSVWKWL